jgi:hypothetical protein
MDAHLRMLLQWAEQRRENAADDEDVYVWWAKVKSSNRQQPLPGPHTRDVLALDAQIRAGADTHLYLTDYRSLYVAHLGEVTADDIRDDPAEREHAPAYYEGLASDYWFRLWDIRLLVSDDTLETIRLLQSLRNVHYGDRPVSLYGGVRELPIVVREDPPRAWFADVDLLTEGRLWVERDAELRGETARLSRDLRDNLLSESVWAALEPSTKTFLASGEAVFRARREDPAFDFGSPAVQYAKAVEVELNALVFPVLRKALGRERPHDRSVRLGERPIDLAGVVSHQTLGALRNFLEHEDRVRGVLRSQLPQDGSWLVGELPHRLRVLEDLRNPAAHSASARRDQVASAREEILGIGQEGLIVRLARAKMRAGL